MTFRDKSLLLSICISLCVHSAVVWTIAWTYTRDLAAKLHQWDDEPIVVERERHPVYVRPTPLPEPEIERLDQMGEADGTGSAVNSSPGEEDQQARQGPQDQAFISRDDEGMGSPMNLPSEYTGAEGANGGARPAPPPTFADGAEENRPSLVMPQDNPPPSGRTVAPRKPDAETDTAAGENEAEANPESNAAPLPPANPEVAMVNPPADGSPTQPPGNSSNTPEKPGSPVASADPAPRSDSESDAFSREGSAEIRNGRVVARSGRKVKTVRPRFTLAGMKDLAALPLPIRIVLQVKIDAAGNVTGVTILQSSGSNEIDLPIQRAVYQWWIEPLKSPDGQAIPDVMIWTITYH